MSTDTAITLENNTAFPNPLREDLIQTAVKFLQNANVMNTPLAQKQKFLQRKGLTDQEIQEACERSGAYDAHEQQQQVQVPNKPRNCGLMQQNQLQLNWFDRLKEIVHSAAVIGAVIYYVYVFYQKVIRRFLFGEKKKDVEEVIKDLEKSLNESVNDVRVSVNNVKEEVDKISQGNGGGTQRQLQELKGEIACVKGLLLNRKQFPPVSSSAPVVPPSIPAWQLASVPPDSEAQHDTKAEELLEIGSGSGSSEPEHATKNSDSSLEIIYSDNSELKDGSSSTKYSRKKSVEDDFDDDV